MKKSMLVLMLVCSVAVAETHWNFQKVNGDGTSSYMGAPPVTLEGIVLNSPEELLNPEPNNNTILFNMGGQWQIFIQGEVSDHAGTALWIGQNYGNLPGHIPTDSYTDAEWMNELCRINHDPNTGYLFHPGDRVRVSGRFLFRNGKNNINENHIKNSAYNFTVELLEAGVGLPQPEVVTLNQLKDPCDQFLFDSSRNTGCEYYQARLVRVNDVSFTGTFNWGPGQTVTVTDGTRTFPVLLGRGSGFNDPNNLPAVFDVVGILDQDDGASPFTGGYRIWVANYDGNGQVLRDRGYRRGNLPTDVNRDGVVDLADFAAFSAQWLSYTSGIAACD